jgi:hypothetical protein
MFIHRLTIPGQNMLKLYRLLDDYQRAYPGVILNRWVGHLGKVYRIEARENLHQLLADAGFPCSVEDTRFFGDWDNPQDAIYDKWREYYQVPDRDDEV